MACPASRRSSFWRFRPPLSSPAARRSPSSTPRATGDRVLFSKWNSFSRVAVYDRPHGDWSLSPSFTGPRIESLFMDIDSAASTPIVKGTGQPSDARYLRYELTALGYHLVEQPAGFSALVIGPGGGRDLLSALVFGATHVDGVEINPIIAARRHAGPVSRLLGRHLSGSARRRFTSTTAAASSGEARRATT